MLVMYTFYQHSVCLGRARVLLAAEFLLIIRSIFALSFLISQEFSEPSREVLNYPILALALTSTLDILH